MSSPNLPLLNSQSPIHKSPLRCDITAQHTPPSKRKVIFGDRFIPSQVRRTLDFSGFQDSFVTQKNDSSVHMYLFYHKFSVDKACDCDIHKDFSSSNYLKFIIVQEKRFEEIYKTLLNNELVCPGKDLKMEKDVDYEMDQSERSFFFSYKPCSESQPSVFGTSPANPYCIANQKILSSEFEEYRKISTHPFKVLDAPGLPNDFYLNLLDWSTKDIVAVALGNRVYLWEFSTCKVTNLMENLNIDKAITSVKWSKESPNILAFSTASGSLYLIDIALQKVILTKHISCGHRIGCMDWNSHVLALGARDGIIQTIDTRNNRSICSASEHGHNLEVCGLKWDQNGKILASGGNDNRIFLWNLGEKIPLNSLNGHQGAVKALAWSPHEYGLLASGGGSADRCIKFWNTKSDQLIRSVDTHSQVCNLHWSSTNKELLSTHGFSSNAINLWVYPSMEKLISLKGHTSRVIYMGSSPDGEKIVTGSSDETLRFWNVFAKDTSLINKNDYDYFPSGNIR